MAHGHRLVCPLKTVTSMYLLTWLLLVYSAVKISVADDLHRGSQSLHSDAVQCPPPVKKNPELPSPPKSPNLPYPYPYYYYYTASSPSRPPPSFALTLLFGFFSPAAVLLLGIK